VEKIKSMRQEIDALVGKLVSYLSDYGLTRGKISRVPEGLGPKIEILEKAKWSCAELGYLTLRLRTLNRIGEDDPIKAYQAGREVPQALLDVYEKLRIYLKKTPPTLEEEDIVPLFKAKTYWACRDYDKALDTYRKLQARVDKKMYNDLFWRVFTERVECAYEGYRHDAEEMENLKGLIMDTRAEYPDMRRSAYYSRIRRVLDNIRKVLRR
jgi:hypothetical protein